jgi:ribonuclease R
MELIKKQILRVLCRRDYRPMSQAKLAEAMGYGPSEYSNFQSAVQSLRQQGQILIGVDKTITLPAMSNGVIGTFRANERGFGFIVPLERNAHGDLFVPPDETAGAMNGDIVAARVVQKNFRGQMRYSGVVTEIIERGSGRFVGLLQQDKGGGWYVVPEGKGYFPSIQIQDATSSQARPNDKVIVEVVSYPKRSDMAAQGAIVQVLGRAGNYETEINSIIAQYSLPYDFPEECRQQAREAAEGYNPDAAAMRDDITKEVIITIDPPDAKDFDDAISLRKDKEGNWILGVHIADVSAFIPMHSPLDKEAQQRGNSVYLPGRVIPMLPEVLSNGICSLQPEQKRFAKTAYITYDPQGNIMGTEFANSIICSRARLTYEQADDILHGKAAGFAGEVVALLKDMETLARAIERRREKNGMIHLDLPETELVFDKAGRVIDAHPADNCYPHTMIEMFMVEANDAVASALDRFGIPFMRRIHPDPDAVSTKNISRFVKLCGIKVPRHLDRAAIQDLLAAVKDTPLAHAVNMYVLRSMQRAEYSPLNIGHFALASRHYCHFTSPIRRYADLMIHRLMDCYAKGKLSKIGLEEVLPEAELIEIGRHISFTENQADGAEKELKTVLILQMLSKKVGDEMNCVVSGLTNFGVFVQCLKFGIEGLIEPGDLGMDEWRFVEKAQAVVGKNSGKSIHLGQPMKVRIVSVNVPGRQLFLAPAEPLIEERKGRRFNPEKWLKKKERKKHR